MLHPEVLEYPDSGKIGAVAGSAPGGDKRQRTLFFFARRDSGVDYWEGEYRDAAR